MYIYVHSFNFLTISKSVVIERREIPKDYLPLSLDILNAYVGTMNYRYYKHVIYFNFGD